MSKKCPGKKVKTYSIFNDLTWPHRLTHPPTHQTIHPPIGERVSTDFKSSNRIEISWLVQILLNFYWFWGSPSVGLGWVEWVCGGWGWCGGHIDDVRMMGTMGTMWGWWGQHGNNMGTTGTTKSQNKITFEQIKIIQFCLKIWDPWTLLHTYRLDLICWWVVSLWNCSWNENKVQNLTKMSNFTHNC